MFYRQNVLQVSKLKGVFNYIIDVLLLTCYNVSSFNDLNVKEVKRKLFYVEFVTIHEPVICFI